MTTSKTLLSLEIFCMKVCIYVAAITAILGLLIGIFIHSTTLILNGFVSIIEMLCGYLTLVTAKKISTPPDDDFHFGFYKMEPFVANLESTLIASCCVSALIFAIRDIVHDHSITNIGLGLDFTYLFTALSLSVAVLLYIYYKRTQSSLIKANLIIWRFDSLMAIGILIGFVIAHFLEVSISLYQYTRFVDPAMSIILSFVLLKEPIDNYKASLLDLLDASPGDKTEKLVQSLFENYFLSRNLPKPEYFFRIRKAGRRILLYMYYQPAPETPLQTMEALRKELSSIFKENLPNCGVTLIPTLTLPKT
jgi:predicted Co/Zn/Cd cation transporter (cation efflux family)